MSAQPFPIVTPDEYLQAERAAMSKSEYVSGQIWAMSGASFEHNTIAFNLGGLLHTALKGKPCRGFGSDLRVFVGSNPSFFYPDLTIVCGEPQFTDAHVDTVINPQVVIEIASPSTARYDRTVKMIKYRQLPSLREYVLVAQDSALVEWWTLKEGLWEESQVTGLSKTVTLESVAVTLALSEIYDGVTFPAE